MSKFSLYFRIWALVSVLWIILCTFFYFQSGIPANDTAPQRWEKEFTPLFTRLQQLYAADRAPDPAAASKKLNYKELAIITDKTILQKLDSIHLLSVWCEVYKAANNEIKNYQPQEKVEYLMFRAGIKPGVFAYNFIPYADCAPDSGRQVEIGADPFRFIAGFKPSGAKNLTDLLEVWKETQRQHRVRVIGTSIGVPVVLFILMLGLCWIQSSLTAPKKFFHEN